MVTLLLVFVAGMIFEHFVVHQVVDKLKAKLLEVLK